MAVLTRSPQLAPPYAKPRAHAHTASKILIVDSSTDLWDRFVDLVQFADMVVETTATLPNFPSSGRPETPTCLIINLQVFGQAALDFQSELCAANIFVPIILVTNCDNIPMMVRAIKNGAIDVLSMPLQHDDVLALVQFALSLDRDWCARQSDLAGVRVRYETLSQRERDVMAEVVKGRLNKQVAGDLGISEITVKAHRGRMMRKMQARSLPDLVGMAKKIDCGSLGFGLPFPWRYLTLRSLVDNRVSFFAVDQHETRV